MDIKRKILIDNSIDTAISFVTSADFLAILATSNLKTKIYTSERSDPSKSSKKIRIIREILYRKANGVVFQTEQAKNFFGKPPRTASRQCSVRICLRQISRRVLDSQKS